MQPRHLANIAFLLALDACAGEPREPREAPHGNRWGKDYFPNLPLITQDGKTVRFYDDLIKGKTVLISFIYTSCPDVCPLTTARLAQVQQRLGESMGRDIFFYSLSVDPEVDSPARLKEFAKAFHTGPGWLFLTGRPEDVWAIRSKLGDRSRTLSEHRQQIVLGNDATGEWARNTTFGDLERLLMDVRAMNPQWRDEVRTPDSSPASNTGYALGGEAGSAMFKKMCAPCHTIGVGDRVGPDLRGVTTRREPDWLARFIMDPHRLLRQKDPIALALAKSYPGAIMPRLGVTKNDAADLIAYLSSQTARLSAGESSTPHQHAHKP